MKKIILLLILAFTTFLASQSTFAISYQGSSTRAYPATSSGGDFRIDTFAWDQSSSCMWWLWANNNNSTIPHWTFCGTDSSSRRRATYARIVEIEPYSWTWTSYTPVVNVVKANWEAYATLSAGTYLSFDKTSSGSWMMKTTVRDSSSNIIYQAQVETFLPWNPWYTGSALPSRYVVMLSTEFSEVEYTSTDIRYYIREFNLCTYVSRYNENVCTTQSFVNSTFPEGLLIRTNNAKNVYLPTSWQSTSGALYEVVYTPPYDLYAQAWNKAKWIEFTTGTGAGTLTQWLGGQGSNVFFNSSWSGTTSWNGTTWSTWTWYYVDCGTLDVGCYIAGTATRFADAWIEARDSTLDWLFPDINFNGLSSTCATGSGNIVASGSVASLPFMQKLVNIFAVAVPIAPAQDSEVCTINWDVKTIHYGRSTPTVVDWLIILMCIVPIFFALPHKNPTPHV